MVQNKYSLIALAITACLLCLSSLYALETDLLNDPKIIKALQEDEIEIVKVEQIFTDVNISKHKKGYTIIMAKAKMPKVPNLGGGHLKNAYNPWGTFGFCANLQKESDDLHILFIIMNNKKSLDTILYESKIKVSLDTNISLAFDGAKNYDGLEKFSDRTMFLLSSEGCNTIRYFFLGIMEYTFYIDDWGND